MAWFRLILIPLALGLAACSASSGGSGDGASTSVATSSFAAPAGAASVPGGSASLQAGDYKIAPLDILDISVFQVPDLTKTVQVSSSGQISLPLIGTVQASGKSPAELERQLGSVLGAKYLQSPQVSVFVKEYTSQKVTVEGSVNKPGIYPMSGKTTLLRAIALAGGLDRVADPRGIVVFREVDGKRQAAKFDLPAIRSGSADDPVIAGGDVVVVDEHGGKTALRGIRESLGIFGLFSPIL
jgi:polysaccharide export outer membrane protein